MVYLLVWNWCFLEGSQVSRPFQLSNALLAGLFRSSTFCAATLRTSGSGPSAPKLENHHCNEEKHAQGSKFRAAVPDPVVLWVPSGGKQLQETFIQAIGKNTCFWFLNHIKPAFLLLQYGSVTVWLHKSLQPPPNPLPGWDEIHQIGLIARRVMGASSQRHWRMGRINFLVM